MVKPRDAALVARVLSFPRHETRERAATLIDACGGLMGLARATPAEIAEHLADQGAAARRAGALWAAFELGRRVALEEATPPLRLASSADVATWATPRLAGRETEELWMLALDGRSRLRAARRVASGGLSGLSVRASDPLRLALRSAASAFVLVHNHPSGDPTPSPEDVVFTRRVADAAAVVGVPLVDHVVVSRSGFASVPFSAEAG
jgi:DNA repair protein RadC